MELHSYAKRRVNKNLTKWSTVHKRKLVEARITHDALFTNMPRSSLAPWKKVVALAELDDYSVFFVRKQWSYMINKYKQYKQIRLDNMPNKAIDNEMIRKITNEWEFFESIHRFMTNKTNNLHSYALPLHARTLRAINAAQQRQQQRQQATAAPSNNANSNSSTERSDTNEDFVTINSTSENLNQQPNASANTDHDFYTKKFGNQQLNYYADVSEDTQESMVLEHLTQHPASAAGVTTEAEPIRLLIASEQIVEMKTEPSPLPMTNGLGKHRFELNGNVNAASGSNATVKTPCCAHKANEKVLSERDKYYRHKRRFNRRLERRFDSILNVFGQIVKAEYPNIDVSPVLGGAAQVGATMANRLFNSDDEDSADEQNASSADETVRLNNEQAMKNCENGEKMHPNEG